MSFGRGCAVFLLPLSAAFAQSAPPPLWGSLQPGPHQVGFRQLLLRDPTRPELPVPASSGAAGPSGRQMQVLIWYPAGRGGVPLTYGDYIMQTAQRLDFAPPTAARRSAALDDYVARAASLGGDTLALRAALPRLLRTPVAARRHPLPARGRFPLVIYPEWRAPASNSILAEYLASHGYVVASIGLRGTYDDDVEYFAVRGIEALAGDFAYVLAALDTVRYVDTRNAATMGVGIAATGALALQIRAPSIRAFVSLDGGVTTEGEQRLLVRTPLFDVSRVRVPMLAITAPHPNVDAARLELYRYSTRHIVHFPGMGEFWFLDYGMLDRMIPRIIGAPPGNTVLGSEWAAGLVERFLAANLKGDSTAGRWLERAAPPSTAPGLFTVTVRPGLPPPPSLPRLKRIIDSSGIAAMAGLIAARTASDAQPIPAEYFTNLNAWLGEGRDGNGAKRHELMRLRVAMYPGSARAHFARAASALRLRDSTLAREHVGEALRRFVDDPDPLLDAPVRAAIRRTADALGLR